MTLALLLPWILTGITGADPTSLCLKGGQVIDPDRRVVVPAEVTIREGKIAAVGAACHGTTLDVTGKFLMPGLIDLHVHAWGNPSPTGKNDQEFGLAGTAARVLQAGVMGLLDLGGDETEELAVRDELRGSPDHAAFFTSGTLFLPGTPRAGRQGARFARTPAQAHEQVRALAPYHPDVIKIIFYAPTIAALVAEASAQGLKTIVHINSWDEARQAVAAGATVITHFEDEATIPDDLVAAMVAHHTLSIPTMAVQCDLAALVSDPRGLADPLLARVTSPELRQEYRALDRFTGKANHWLGWQREGCRSHDFASVRRLVAAHVPVLAGSDTGNLGTFQGYSVHREMELLTEAGLPPWDALRSATTEAARFLGIGWGMAVGAPANLLVLEASPLVAMKNSRRITHIIYQGRLIKRAAP